MTKSLIAMLPGEADSTDIREFVRCVIREFNGPGGLAQECKKAFDQPQATAASKQQMLNMIGKLWMAVLGNEDDTSTDMEAIQAEAEALQRKIDDDG